MCRKCAQNRIFGHVRAGIHRDLPGYTGFAGILESSPGYLRVLESMYRTRPTLVALAVAVTAVGLAGCGIIKPGSSNPTPGTWTPPSTSTSTSTSPSASTPTSAKVNIGDETVIGYFGQTTTATCEAGKSLNITGANNTLTITGPCETVTVSGFSNTVTFGELKTEVTVTGYGNKLTYKTGEPKVNNYGSNNTIQKAS
ncbi:Protein of uncharacterised function (DUF3060) [Mycobacteroides abscessus subsp. abscessus]|nr:Protein of uncharacterised function (DUF3060) [Mycobacteroides abscessus subsp. abscessus]